MDGVWCLLFLLPLLTWTVAQNVHRRMEYKYSFKGPYLAQKDNQVPFWTYSGNAIASEESVRITPSLRSQKGQTWTKNPTNFEWWEVEFVFRVTGRGRIGADGLAFWFTSVAGVEGPVFGSNDQWNGLGVFFDSFDNDNKRNNPYIMAMVNDGTQVYDHEHDGLTQQTGGCLRDFRNKPFPVRAKIEYYKNILTLFIHNGMTNNDKDYEICMRAENIHLPSAGYFGVTAATGGLADDHDVLKFIVHSLRSPDEMAQLSINQEEEEKFKKEFDQYQDKTKKAREDYLAQNPEAARQEQREEYETGEERELRQIFQGQSLISETIRSLHQKMDEIIGRQERTLGLINNIGGGVVAPSGGVPPVAGNVVTGDSIRRHEVDALLNNQRDIVSTARDIKNFVNEIHQKSNQLLSKSTAPQGSAQPVGYDVHVTLKEMQEGINIVKRDLGTTNQQLQRIPGGGAQACPQVNCVSTSMFIGFIVLQVVLLIGFSMYKDSKEAQAKKFY